MAISTRKKNLIIADWKTGRFKSFYSIAKEYKIDISTAKKILVDISQSNADVVEVGTIYESAKKSTKNLVEINAIEKAVADRIKVHTVSNKLLEKIEGHIDDNEKLEKINVGVGVQSFEKVGLGSGDYKNLADAIDKISVTTGINPRFASTVNIQNTNSNIQQTGISVKFLDED